MVNLNKTYVIGTHIMWFEIEMFSDFIDGMINLIQDVENDIDLHMEDKWLNSEEEANEI